MLRRSLVALMMGVICAGSAETGESAEKRQNPAPTGLVSWLKNKTSNIRPAGASGNPKSRNTGRTRIPTPSTGGGIERAVVRDAERQAVPIHQTSGRPQDSEPFEPMLLPVDGPLQPVPIQQAPVLPNISTVSGPQYFSATADGFSNPVPVYPSNNWQTYQPPVSVEMHSGGYYSNMGGPLRPAGPADLGSGQMSVQTGGTYPQTGAALYPAPIPGIPVQIGGTSFPNPAFHPHEMLYAHRYKAMYPPYYYKVNGGWMVTPFGVWSHEDWRLQGTQVDVKYKSFISPFTLFHPPTIR